MLEPGCEGEPQTRCQASAGEATTSTWCSCEGQTVTSSNHLPPEGVRYRSQGPCAPRAFLRVQPSPQSAEDEPRAQISLMVNETETSLGTFTGICSHSEPDEPAVLLVRCWFAGAGDEISVRREGDELVVCRDRVFEDAPSVRSELTRVAVQGELEFDTQVE